MDILFIIFMYWVIHGRPVWEELIKPLNRKKPTKREVDELMHEVEEFTKGNIQ
jgi:hypothetical protein